MKCSAQLDVSVAKAYVKYGAACPDLGGAPLSRATAEEKYQDLVKQETTTAIANQTYETAKASAPALQTEIEKSLPYSVERTSTPPRFALDAAGATVTDSTTNLQWELKTDNGDALHDASLEWSWFGFCANDSNVQCQRDDECPGSTCSSGLQPMTAHQWLRALNTANFAGHNDWRLPTVLELNTIKKNDPCSVAGFPCTSIPGYTGLEGTYSGNLGKYLSADEDPLTGTLGYVAGSLCVFFGADFPDASCNSLISHARAVRP